MRKVLLRFVLDDAWKCELVEGVPYLGFGFLLLPWLLFGLWWLRRARRSGEGSADLAYPVAMWIAVPVIALVVRESNPLLATTGLPVFGYGFMIVIGLTVGVFLASRRAQSAGVSAETIWDMCLWLFIPGIVGARVFYVVQYHERVFDDCGNVGQYVFAAINLTTGGLVFYGALMCGIGGFVAFCHRRRISLLLLADIVVPSLFVGLGFGRLGCLLYGCCYGEHCDFPWAISFPRGSMTFDALVHRGLLDPAATETHSLHPTQIYSSISAFLLAALLAAYFRRRPWDGAVLAVAWIVYPVTRFILECLRGDEPGQFNTSLTISQWISVALFTSGIIYCLVLYAWRRRSGTLSASSG